MLRSALVFLGVGRLGLGWWFIVGATPWILTDFIISMMDSKLFANLALIIFASHVIFIFLFFLLLDWAHFLLASDPMGLGSEPRDVRV